MSKLFLFGLFILSGVQGQSAEDIAWFQKKMLTHETGEFSQIKIHILRLAPNEDLLDSIWKYSRVKNFKAASIVSAVGSLKVYNIRFANQEFTNSTSGFFEIVSLSGNIDLQNQKTDNDYKGNGHIHISISNETGNTIGGHLVMGNIVYTTIEITILEIVDGLFSRVEDDGTNGSGYEELKVFKVDRA